MENTSNTTNNVNADFTTTKTNEYQIHPAQLELAKLQGELETTRLELEHLRRSIDTANVVSNDKSETISKAVATLINQLDAFDIADIIYELPKQKIIDVVRILTNMNSQYVKDAIQTSVNSDDFETEIDDLDTYIADAYTEDNIVNLIDEKYSWSTLLRVAFKNNSIDTDDVVDYVDTDEILADEFRKGNVSFYDMMEHFDTSDCFEYLDNQGSLSWSEVKDYVDMDDVKADIEIDNDMIGEYISNLNDSDFRNLITNLS